MKKIFSGGYYKTFLLRILFAFILFTLTRILFYIFNLEYFHGTAFWNILSLLFFGLRFDLSAIIICYSPFILLSVFPFHLKSSKAYQKILLILYTLSTTIAVAANLLDCGYFKFTLSRTTADIFNMLGLGSDLTTLLPQYLKDFWFLFLILLILVILTVWFFNKTKIIYHDKTHKNNYLKFYLKEGLIFIVAAALSIIGFRGGLQLRPINIVTAGEYASSKNVALVLNTPFAIIKTIGAAGLKEYNFFDQKTLDKIYSPVHNYYKKNRSQKTNNVVIIILESFSKEYIGSLNKGLDNNTYKGYTPFLDSLISESLVFPNAYANGKRSVEAISAVLAGIPSLMNDAYITSMYSGNNINSLAYMLKEKGYSSAFYHGGTNGTMGFDNFISLAGFDKYYGRTEYNNEKDYDGKWGIYDEEFLDYTAGMLDKCSKPFVAGIYTLSSHHPYTIPEKYSNAFPKGKLTIHQSIGYTDHSLKKFFEQISKKTWFDSTLFVITADHTSESVYPQYQTRTGMYAIPLIFYQHNSRFKGKDNIITQQIDIIPSVLDFLNYDKPFLSFGNSVFDSSSFHFAVNFVNGSYQIIYNDYAFVFDGTSGISLYKISDDSLLKNNILESSPAIKKEIELKLKAIIQSYNHRVIKNQMILNNDPVGK